MTSLRATFDRFVKKAGPQWMECSALGRLSNSCVLGRGRHRAEGDFPVCRWAYRAHRYRAFSGPIVPGRHLPRSLSGHMVARTRSWRATNFVRNHWRLLMGQPWNEILPIFVRPARIARVCIHSILAFQACFCVGIKKVDSRRIV